MCISFEYLNDVCLNLHSCIDEPKKNTYVAIQKQMFIADKGLEGQENLVKVKEQGIMNFYADRVSLAE